MRYSLRSHAGSLPALVCGTGSVCARSGAAFNPAEADGGCAWHSGAAPSQGGKWLRVSRKRKEEEGWMEQTGK